MRKYIFIILLVLSGKFVSAQEGKFLNDSLLMNDFGFQIMPNNDLIGYGEIVNKSSKIIVINKVQSNGGDSYVDLRISRRDSIKLYPESAAIYFYHSFILKSKYSNDTSAFFNSTPFQPKIIINISYSDSIDKNRLAGGFVNLSRRTCRNFWNGDDDDTAQISLNEWNRIKNKIRIEVENRYGYTILDEWDLKVNKKVKKVFGAFKISNDSEYSIKIDSMVTESPTDTVYSAFTNTVIPANQSLLCFYKSDVISEKYGDSVDALLKETYKIKCKIYYQCNGLKNEIPLTIKVKKENLITSF